MSSSCFILRLLLAVSSIIIPSIYGYPCDYIDKETNLTNCGICLKNDSCSWCTYDDSCHVSATYDKTCGDDNNKHSGHVIHGSNHLFKCCEYSDSCQDCSRLWYVECDWCISTKKCFNETAYQCPSYKDVVYKDGVCHGDPKQTLWDKLRHYYFEIPIIYRVILIVLASLCLILFCICICLFCNNKCKKRKKKRGHFKKGNIQTNFISYTSMK